METVTDMERNGEEIPRPFFERRYNGNIPTRVTPMVHRKLAIEAARKGISMNRLATAKLAM